MELVRGLDHLQSLAPPARGQACGGCIGERPLEEPADALETLRRERNRACLAARANGSACPWREADQGAVVPARRAAGQVREVPGEPEQLELKRENERIQTGRRGEVGRRSLVEDVQEAGQGVEGTWILVVLQEEPQDCLEPDMADGEPEPVGAARVMRTHKVDTGDRVQLAAPLVEDDLDVRERFQAASEARHRLARALRDCPDPAPLEREEVENPIRFPVADRPQDNSLRLPGARHDSQSRARPCRYRFTPGYLRAMARIQMYTTAWCGYCVRAKALLDARGLEYEEIPLDGQSDFRARIQERTGGWTVPQIVIDGRPIGGYTELWQLDRHGGLEQLAA